jgi:hypothetical protein
MDTTPNKSSMLLTFLSQNHNMVRLPHITGIPVLHPELFQQFQQCAVHTHINKTFSLLHMKVSSLPITIKDTLAIKLPDMSSIPLWM